MAFYARLIRSFTSNRKAFEDEATRFRLRREELDELGCHDYTMATRFRLTKADGRIIWNEISAFLSTEVFSKNEMDAFLNMISSRDRRFKLERNGRNV